jgi:hypothetical protein
VFHEVDAALAKLITDEALGDAAVAVAFDVPNRPWFAAVQAPTLNAFLYDVRENALRRDVMHEPVLDDQGRVVGRRPPPPRYDLYYLLSVWGVPDPALEHHLMASVLSALARFDVFPTDRVPEPLRDLGLWHLNVAGGPKRMMPGNFGGEMKLQAEVSVTVPLPTRVTAPVAPAVHRPMDVRMSGAGGQRETVAQRTPAPGGPGGPPGPAGVPRQAPPGGAADPARQREQLARAVAEGRPAQRAAQPPGGPAGRPAGRPAQGGPAQGGPGQGGPGQGPGQPPQRPTEPLAVLRVALAQAAQAQAALAHAQSVVAQAMAGARPPAARPPAAPAAAAPAAAAPAAAAPPAAAPPAAAPPADPPPAPAP